MGGGGPNLLRGVQIRCDTGIGETHSNNLLTSVNVPPIHHKTLKRREREAGQGLETMANRVMAKAAKALLEEVTKRQVSFFRLVLVRKRVSGQPRWLLIFYLRSP